MQDEIPYLVDITEKLHESAPDSKYVKSWYTSMQQYRDALMASSKGGIAVGSEAPDIVLQNPSGDTIKLSSLRGQYVLLDFWASWCGPCRQENPNVVSIYKKYHAKGFDIFSVSLDANKEQWLRAIAKDGLVWSHHGCDFGGWQSAPAQAYSIQAIPSTLLLDKSGIVIAKDLRGEELEERLNKLLNTAPAP
jgi:thiol-disulfide isomerase/thioredoxin